METPSHRQAFALIAMLIATTALSQFFRASTNVIAPELIRDLALTPEMLGFANACFFIALGVAQVPVGILFDRVGARVTVFLLASIAVVGAALHLVVTDGRGLAAVRFLTGLGHGGSFMAAVFLVSRWYPRPQWATALSWVFGASMLGIVAAGTPLALAANALGWRQAFLIFAAIQAITGVLFFLLVRDDPPGHTPPPRPPESMLAALAGFWSILKLPGLRRVMALQLVAYAVIATLMGLWAGPYLHDVHGLSALQRGNVLIAMAAAQTAGVLLIGPLDRIFDTRKWIAACAALATVVTLLALAAVPHPPLELAIALLLMVSAVSSYGIVVVAHGRSFYPEALAGRGATTFNLAQVAGCALMPIGTGIIAGWFPTTASGYSPIAYQWIFASIAGALAAGLAIYLSSRDMKPSGAVVRSEARTTATEA